MVSLRSLSPLESRCPDRQTDIPPDVQSGHPEPMGATALLIQRIESVTIEKPHNIITLDHYPPLSFGMNYSMPDTNQTMYSIAYTIGTRLSNGKSEK
jgi:hypothetical protein